jgi:hypothetical protein
MVSEKAIRISDQDMVTVKTITETLNRIKKSKVLNSDTIAIVIQSLESSMTKSNETKVLDRLEIASDHLKRK